MSITNPITSDRLRIAGFGMQLFILGGVAVFCILSLALRQLTPQDATWYYSTLTFIVGLFVPSPKPSNKTHTIQQIPTITVPTHQFPSAPNNSPIMPSSPEHVPEVKIIPQKDEHQN